MKSIAKIFLLLAVANYKIITFAEAADTPKRIRDYAQVQVQSVEIGKRSKDTKTTTASTNYQVRINGLGKQFELNLESPRHSIFTPSFQYLEASENLETEKVQIEEFALSQKELDSIESNFFIDLESNAAVSLKQGANQDENSFQLSGRIDDMSILTTDDGLHELSMEESPNDGDSRNDYVDINRNVTVAPAAILATRSWAKPEVFVLFDFTNSRLFGNKRGRILDYLGVFFHAVNNRYATASDPRISFRISGVMTILSRGAQRFIEDNKIASGYDANQILDDFSSWLYSKRRQTPKYDVAAIITGADIKDRSRHRRKTSNLSGLAFLKGACLKNVKKKKFMGCSISEDFGGFYEGAFTVAHELAHNLGAPHDGQDEASKCPWEDGHIMSYAGWGSKNKFLFSRCSLKLMKAFINSKEASCTKTHQSFKTIPISDDNIGDRLSMRQQCVRATNNTKAVPDPDTSANDLCKNLKCKHPISGKPGSFRLVTLNHPPGDDAPCGKHGGRCVNGNCVRSR